MNTSNVAQQQPENGWSPIWLVPLVALFLGIWMWYDHVSSQGPLITISFATAEGLEAGKTRIKTRSVDVGLVESVTLDLDSKGITVRARIDKSAASLLTSDARFWVVRPRIGNGGISGLGTLLSGAYIELDPGNASVRGDEFIGLEDVPLTSPGTPGLALTLYSSGKHSLSVADPVLYRGFKVGQVESVNFDPNKKQAEYRIFVHSPYDVLLSENTQFWNVGGFELDATAEGINVSAGSLETLLGGGVTFAVPPDLPVGKAVSEGHSFRLYDNRKAAFNRQYRFVAEYLVLLEDSVRGLRHGAPVEYRGIRIGTVAKVNVEGIERSGKSWLDKMIPVLIHLEPGRVGYGDTQQALDKFRKDFSSWVKEGMSARLETGNLISGSQFVSLNFHNDKLLDFPDFYSGYQVVPTSQDGFGQITDQLKNLLDKFNQLPIEDTVLQANKALAQIDRTLQQLDRLGGKANELLDSESSQEMPEQLLSAVKQLNETLSGISPGSDNYRQARQVMSELNSVLNEVQPLLRELNSRPSALLFSQPKAEDEQPGASR